MTAITAAGATSGWEKPYKAKTDFDKFIGDKTPTNRANLEAIFNTNTDAIEKARIEQYFTDANTNSYKTKIGNTEYTITKIVSSATPPVVTYIITP